MVGISVIVPVYNMEKYLNECLDSIINQSFTDIEIICVDYGSTDTSAEILNDYASKDSRIKIITQENNSVSAARNAGLDNVAGEYIYFVDADDYLELTALEEMHSIMKDKNLDLLIFKLVNFNENTGEVNYNYSDMPFLLNLDNEVFSYHDFEEDLFKVDVTIYTKLYKRELLSNARFPEGLIFEDNAFYYDYIFNAKRIFFLDKCLYWRRIRNDSTITLCGRNHCDLIIIYHVIYDKFKKMGIYDEYRERLFMRKIDSIHYRFTTIRPEYKQEYFDLMKNDFLNQKSEYDNDFDLTKISRRTKRIYNAVLKSNNPNDVKSNMKKKKAEKSKFRKLYDKLKRKI